MADIFLFYPNIKIYFFSLSSSIILRWIRIPVLLPICRTSVTKICNRSVHPIGCILYAAISRAQSVEVFKTDLPE